MNLHGIFDSRNLRNFLIGTRFLRVCHLYKTLRPKSIIPVTSQHPLSKPQEVCNKLARAKVHSVCCVVSFPKFHYNDLLPTYYGLVGDTANYIRWRANKSVTTWQQIGNFPLPGKLRGNMSNGFWPLRSTSSSPARHPIGNTMENEIDAKKLIYRNNGYKQAVGLYQDQTADRKYKTDDVIAARSATASAIHSDFGDRSNTTNIARNPPHFLSFLELPLAAAVINKTA